MSVFKFNKKSHANIKSENESDLELNVIDSELDFQGVRFPWEASFALGIGMASEVVDSILMSGTLNVLAPELSSFANMVVSFIIGAGCFLSMAFAGFQLGNRHHYSKLGIRMSYLFWALAGLALVVARLIAGLTQGTTTIFDVFSEGVPLSEVLGTETFISNITIAIVQAALYIGTGFMTRDSSRILTDSNMREYFNARHKYRKMIQELSDKRNDIVEDLSKLRSYQKYAKRLAESKKSAKDNIEEYNAATKALVETKMAVIVDPDIMEGIYDHAIAKEKAEIKDKKLHEI